MTDGLYSFTWNKGYARLEGTFIADSEEVARLVNGAYVYFGEVAGKHSEVYGNMGPHNVHLESEVPAFIQSIKANGMETGFNPLHYVKWDCVCGNVYDRTQGEGGPGAVTPSGDWVDEVGPCVLCKDFVGWERETAPITKEQHAALIGIDTKTPYLITLPEHTPEPVLRRFRRSWYEMFHGTPAGKALIAAFDVEAFQIKEGEAIVQTDAVLILKDELIANMDAYATKLANENKVLVERVTELTIEKQKNPA